MKTIAFLGQKGGSGKTTLAVHVAVAAQEAGEVVVVADTDPQQSANGWAAARYSDKRTDEPSVVPVFPSELKRLAADARTEEVTLLIIDTAPHVAPAAAQIAAVADLAIIPCRPTAFDLATIEAATRIVQAAKVKGVFVMSACPPRCPELAETRAALESYGMPVCPVQIGERRAFSRAVATGRSVTEFEKNGKAAEEIRALWAWVSKELK